jgi:hypothetical protein
LKAIELPHDYNGSKDIRYISNAELLSLIDGSKK